MKEHAGEGEDPEFPDFLAWLKSQLQLDLLGGKLDDDSTRRDVHSRESFRFGIAPMVSKCPII